MDNAFLVRLSVSIWTARKIDKNATREAKTRAGATEKAGVKVYKSVIAADALDKIASIAGAARNEHRARTTPWSYDGPGAITAEGYPAYKAAMAGYEREFDLAVAHFYSVYAQERENAIGYLGNMFDPHDYPNTDQLHDKFSFHVSAEPMPAADNFQVRGLPVEVVEEIKKDIKDQNAKALDNANQSAWTRVIETVEKLKLRLEEYSSGKVTKFYESWVDNVAELIKLIPSINVANDAELSRIGQKLAALTAYSVEDLKAEPGLRAEIIKQAGAVLAGINAVYKRAA
jgi:hypothetical protein